MASRIGCKAVGCQQQHNKHYCKICHTKDSDHRALNCPYSRMHRRQNIKIVNGLIVREGTNYMKSCIFNGIWNYLIPIIVGYIHTVVHYVEYAVLCDFIAVMMLCALIWFWHWIKPEFTRVRKMDKFFFVLLAIIFALFAVVFDGMDALRTRVETLEYGYDVLAEGIKALDARVDAYDKRYNDTFLRKDTFVGTLDGHLVAALEKMGISRARLRMGCFIEGTPIQVDKYGGTVKIENFRPGDYVYNPVLQRQFRSIPIFGNETGHMYEFVTEHDLSLLVTQHHAMYIMGSDDVVQNMAAKDVEQGKLTMVMENQRLLYQQFVEIRSIPVDGVQVYNLLMIVPDDTPITSRAIIANGTVTLDFAAQQVHEKILN